MRDKMPVSYGGPDELTDMEAGLVQALIDQPDVGAASGVSGYRHRDAAELALRREPVKKAIKANRQRRLETDLGNLALNTIKAMMGKEYPPSTRLKAAIWVMEAAGHGKPPEGTGDKGMAQMSTAELEHHVKQLALAAEAAMKPVVELKPVVETPDSGA